MLIISLIVLTFPRYQLPLYSYQALFLIVSKVLIHIVLHSYYHLLDKSYLH